MLSNLRVVFPFRQLISVALGLLLLATVPRAYSQADYIVLKPAQTGAQPRALQNAVVTGVIGTRVMIKEGAGEIGYDLSLIQEIRKPQPVEYTNGMRFIEAGDMNGALPLIKAVVDRYKGLPVQWAQESTAMLGNILLSLGKLTEAEMAFGDFKKAYGGAGSTATAIGEARIAAAKRRFSEAKTIAEPIAKEALTKKNITRAESQLYGQAFFILGQAAEGEGKLPEAMEHYCRVVAVFYQERSVVAEAQKRIDDLRQKGITTP
jgi:tetratricopeptide (TPR) repeat protein